MKDKRFFYVAIIVGVCFFPFKVFSNELCDDYSYDVFAMDGYDKHVDILLMDYRSALNYCKDFKGSKDKFYYGKSLLASGQIKMSKNVFLESYAEGFIGSGFYLVYHFDYGVGEFCVSDFLSENYNSPEYYSVLSRCFDETKFSDRSYEIISHMIKNSSMKEDLGLSWYYDARTLFAYHLYRGIGVDKNVKLAREIIEDAMNNGSSLANDLYVFIDSED